MDIEDLIPAAGFVQRNYCDDCGENLDLKFSNYDEEISGVRIQISGLPVLRCSECKKDHLPDLTRLALLDCHQRSVEAGSLIFASTRRPRDKKFEFTKVPFDYDPDDYFYIPGLFRKFDQGFLTPVFFNREVLLKYDSSPSYRVQFASTTYGTIYTGDEYISFGINKNGLVVMWLGDIAKMPQTEQYYLLSENVPSDHSIGSEFYDGQIECKFTDVSRENQLFKARSTFIEASFKRFGIKIAHLDDEVMSLALAFNAPVVDTDKERRHVADTGLPIHERWQVRPFNCGDYSCVNHHHWRVVRFADSEAPELPRHPGYVQLGADEIEEIKKIIANRRDQDEPVRIIHRSNPERMYELIEQAKLELLIADEGDEI